jgi:hypothetical protein
MAGQAFETKALTFISSIVGDDPVFVAPGWGDI